MSKFLPLMRTGNFKDRHGVDRSITKEVLDKIAKAFNPQKPPVITVGHPDKAKAPVFGVVEALRVVGDKLFFKPAKFCAEFAALVRKGMFPDVSAGLNRNMDGLNHVALLSAQAPAITGLEPIAEFSAPEDDEGVALDVTDCSDKLAEFGAPAYWVENRLEKVADCLRGIKNYIIEEEGVETADKMIPEYCLEMLHDDAPIETIEDLPSKNDGEDETDVAEFSKKLETLDAENKKLMLENAELKAAQRKAEFAAWVEERIAEGRVVPDEKAEMVENLENLFILGGAEFSKNPEVTPNAVDILKRDIMKRPTRDLTTPTKPPEFAASKNWAATPEMAGKFAGVAARKYMDEMAAKGITVAPWDAVNHVMQKM